jgi:hypothetical protein
MKLAAGMSWSYLSTYRATARHQSESEVIQIEAISSDSDFITLKITNKTLGSTAISRIDCKTGLVYGKNYHTRWWIPVPASGKTSFVRAGGSI